MLCGDAEERGLERMLAAGLLDGPLDLLLFPHHGSDSPWLGRLLEAGRPGRVWISAAGEPPVAAELERRGLDWACTGLAGPLTASFPPEPP